VVVKVQVPSYVILQAEVRTRHVQAYAITTPQRKNMVCSGYSFGVCTCPVTIAIWAQLDSRPCNRTGGNLAKASGKHGSSTCNKSSRGGNSAQHLSHIRRRSVRAYLTCMHVQCSTSNLQMFLVIGSVRIHAEYSPPSVAATTESLNVMFASHRRALTRRPRLAPDTAA
jgi:hypothetical protein